MSLAQIRHSADPHPKILDLHRKKLAVIYVRQSSLYQVENLYWLLGSSVQKQAPSGRKKITFPCLQTQEGRCTIRRRQQHPHA